MYRLYSEAISKNGEKIPYLSTIEIMKYVKDVGRSDEIVMVVKHNYNGNNMNIFLIIKKDGDIVVQCNFKELNEVLLNDSKRKLEDIMNECVNPTLNKMNQYLESIGYSFNMFSNFNSQLITIQNLELIFNLKINKRINLKKYREFLSSIFYFVSSDNDKLYFKRVENYVLMNPEDQFISKEFKKKTDMSEIIVLLMNEFSITKEESEEYMKNFISNFKILNGEVLENNGFLIDLTFELNLKVVFELIRILYIFLQTSL